MQVKKVHIELLIYELLKGVYISLIGSISIGDLMAVAIFPFLMKGNPIKNNPLLRKVSWLYLAYFTAQLISELALGNTLTNTAKGLSVTILSFVTVVYLFERLKNNIKLIPYIIFLEGVNALIFMNSADIASTGMQFDLTSVAFFKFKIVPIISNFSLVITYYLMKKNRVRMTALYLMFIVLLYVFNGSRSASLVLFICSIILFVKSSTNLTTKHIPVIFLVGVVFTYSGYLYWVTNIKSINENSSEQVERMTNIYNPFELLIQGRSEFFVGIQAFEDSFLWGHGSWALDKNMKYSNQIAKASLGYIPENYGSSLGAVPIPSHSVLMGAGVNNGIFAFIAMLIIFIFFLRKCITLFVKLYNSKYFIIIAYELFMMIWTFFFSPTSHLRQSLPLIFIIILILTNRFSVAEHFKRQSRLFHEDNNTTT